MNQHLQSILNIIQQDDSLTVEEKNAIAKSLKDADKELEITLFKLDRTEKVKKTTAILLEETIAELALNIQLISFKSFSVISIHGLQHFLCKPEYIRMKPVVYTFNGVFIIWSEILVVEVFVFLLINDSCLHIADLLKSE